MKEVKSVKIQYKAKDGKIFDCQEKCEDYEENLTNLYDETLSELKEYGKTIDDIKFIGVIDLIDNRTCRQINVKDFFEAAKKIYYDAGYGGTEINRTLQIVGDDWWLEREEYDGSEWWEFKTIPQIKNYLETVDKRVIEKYIR